MEKLKELRVKSNHTQKEIAQMLNIERSTYVKWESGTSEPSFANIVKIADLYSVSVDYILKRTENPVMPAADQILIDKKEAPSPEETTLLSRFRALDPEGREEVLHTALSELRRVRAEQGRAARRA